jgi:hypothetical protein
MRKVPANAPGDLLEITMRRYERFTTILRSNRPIEDWPNSLATCPTLGHFSIT